MIPVNYQLCFLYATEKLNDAQFKIESHAKKNKWQPVDLKLKHRGHEKQI